MFRTHSISELFPLDPDEEIVPGSYVGSNDFAEDIELEDTTLKVDPGRGLAIAVFPDEYIPDGPPGLVVTVLWERQPSLNGFSPVYVPYVSVSQKQPKLTLTDIRKRRFSMTGKKA